MNIQRILLIISLSLLAACGGGGTSGTTGGTATPAATVIKGVASKGVITNGTVTVYALTASGAKGAQLGTGSTDGSGAYSIAIGSYSGPVVVEAHGSYTDEATGLIKTVPAATPLRAALAGASGTVTLPVTPLTELAVQQAGTLTAANISAANSLVSSSFKLDIIATVPVAATAAAFQSGSATQAQKDYALTLAAVSQQMQSSGTDLSTTLSAINSGITSAGLTTQTAAAITGAASTFIASPANQTGTTTLAGTTLQSLTTMKLSVAVQGSAAATVKGVQATIELPAGATVRSDAEGKLLPAIITAIGSAAGSSVDGSYAAATAAHPATVTIGLISTAALSEGRVVELTVDLPPGSTVPSAGAFTITASRLVASGGVTASGASLALQ